MQMLEANNAQPKTPEQQQAEWQQFAAQTRKKLKGMSKNELVRACMGLLIENYNLQAAVKEAAEADIVAAEKENAKE